MKYRTIVADPPWPGLDRDERSVRTQSTKGRWGGYLGKPASRFSYSTMTLGEIAALPISETAERSAHLYLWTVNRHVQVAYELVATWGFKASILLTWCKTPMGLGLGGAFSSTSEFVLFARRGGLATTGRVDSSWFQWKRGLHSQKPDAFLDLVEQVSPGPYLELFARRARFGWDYWGDESLGTAELGDEAA